MFTGIIETLGTVENRTEKALTIRARIGSRKLGASIAINGVCLTAVESKKDLHRFDVGPDTWARTNLGNLVRGDLVNVEPSLRIGDEVGGHFVTGHVDAAVPIRSLEPWDEGFWRLRIDLPPVLRGLVATKGSIAVDGISLTVTKCARAYFEVMLVPHTLEITTLRRRQPGDRVNLECDPLARYALNAVATFREKP
jgi:riboflavin synthase